MIKKAMIKFNECAGTLHGTRKCLIRELGRKVSAIGKVQAAVK